MNALEDQLREALADRAAHSPIDPDAWTKTVARSHRRFRVGLPHWLPAGLVIPAAAAAAVIAVVLAATTLTSGTPGNRPSQGGSPAVGATTAPPPGTPRPVTDVLRGNPAVTAIVSATVGGNRVYAWFSNLNDDRLCYVALGTPTSSGGFSCSRWPSGPRVLTGPDVPPVSSGKAAGQATSVTARLNDGSSVPAVVVSGRGFPFKLWFAVIPSSYPAVLTFRDAAGHEIAQLDDTQQVGQAGSVPSHGGISVHGWTAYLTGGKVAWHGPDNGVLLPLPWTVRSKPLLVLFQSTSASSYALGYAPADVTRLALRFPGGATYAGPTVPAWPGSGVRLWVRPGMPWSGLPAQTVVISYNAAGAVIAEQSLSSLLGG